MTNDMSAAVAQPERVVPTDEAWQEFIEQVQRAQHVAIREGEGPRFDLVECALALWREATPPAPAPEPGLPWPTDGPAVPESREPASVAAEARPLSPAAQAIVTAFDDQYENCGHWDDDWQEQCLAAALRAAADQVVPEGGVFLSSASAARTRRDILAIAAELEGSNA